MKLMMLLIHLALIAIFLPNLQADESPSKRQIAQALKKQFADFRAEMSEIKLSNFHGEKLEDQKTFTLYARLEEKALKAYLSMHEPAAIKGSQFWFASQGKDNKVWMKVKGGKLREISGANAGENLLGSEFSLMPLLPDEVKAEDISDPVWVEQDGEKRLRINWQGTERFQKSTLYLDAKTFVPIQADFYIDEQITFQLQFLSYQTIDGLSLPQEIFAINKKTGRKSSLIWLNRDINIKFADELFHPQ
ncbi:MAG: outer membrane lipoprotein-sorting protein [Oligoflexus sp.]